MSGGAKGDGVTGTEHEANASDGFDEGDGGVISDQQSFGVVAGYVYPNFLSSGGPCGPGPGVSPFASEADVVESIRL